jgi:hypothetical protein
MKNLIIRNGVDSDLVRTAGEMLPHMYINPSALQKRDVVRQADPFIEGTYALCPTDNIVVSKVLLRTMDAIRKAVPKAVFEVRNEDAFNDGASRVVLLRLDGERFFRAAIQHDNYADGIVIASHHMYCVNLSRRIRQHMPRVASDSDTTLIRSLKLKNVYADVGRIIKRICEASPVTMSEFEVYCFSRQSCLESDAQKTATDVSNKIRSLIGKGSTWHNGALSDDAREAAFVALESMVTGTPTPTISAALHSELTVAFAAVAQVREDKKLSEQTVPVNILKFYGEDEFVIRQSGYCQRVAQVPECIVPQVATLMAMGPKSSLVGVGAAGGTDNAVEVSMVVIVPAGTRV